MAKDYTGKKNYATEDNTAQGKGLKQDPSWDNANFDSRSDEDEVHFLDPVDRDRDELIRGQFQNNGLEMVTGQTWEKGLHDQSALSPVRADSGVTAPAGHWPMARYDENTSKFAAHTDASSPESLEGEDLDPGHKGNPYGGSY